MRLPIILALAATVAACGQSNEEQLQEAANQSDSAAAEVLNGAAENGLDPQEALQQAGNAAATTNTDMIPPSAQARPNEAGNPNPPAAGQPPEKTVTNTQ